MKLVIKGSEAKPEPELELYLDSSTDGSVRVRGKKDGLRQTIAVLYPNGTINIITNWFGNDFTFSLAKN